MLTFTVESRVESLSQEIQILAGITDPDPGGTLISDAVFPVKCLPVS